jgi:superfamily II DNA or RNA helicase
VDVNQRKDEVQNEAIAKWIVKDKHGTAEIITGAGKTFLGLKALYTMPRHSDLTHLFLAEQKDREVDLEADIIKFNKINSCDVHKDYNLRFVCYQTVRNWSGYKLGLVIADEIHDSMTPENYKFYINNTYNAIIGLTAKFDGKLQYAVKNNDVLKAFFNENIVSKLDMLNKVAPIIFSYTTIQGQSEGTSRLLNIYIVESEIDRNNKNIESGNATTKFFQSEEAAIKYANKNVKIALGLQPFPTEDYYEYQERRNLAIFKSSLKRCSLIYDLPSKVAVANKVMASLIGKTIVFSNSLKAVKKVTTFVVASSNTDSENIFNRAMFDEGQIKTIGSFKKLKQGANLEQADNVILMSYYSTEVDFIQRIGRLRQNKNLVGNVFILVTKDTQEEVWLSKMMTSSTNYKVVRGTLEQCMDKYLINLKE